MKKLINLFALGLLALGLSLPCNADALQQKKINAISGGLGGVWYIGMSAIGKELSQVFPDLEYNLLPGGSVGNPMRVDSGKADFSLTQKTNCLAMQKPSDPYKKKLTHVYSIGVINDSTPLSIIVRDDSPIKTLDDLAQKKLPIRLATGPNGTTSQSFGKWVLEAYGIKLDDIKKWGGTIYTNTYDDVSNMVKDGQIDMFFHVGPGEAGWIRDASLGVKLRYVPIPADKAEYVKKYGLRATIHPKTNYDGKLGNGKDVVTVGDTSEFIVNEKMSEQDVYDLLKALYAKWDNVVLAYPVWKTFVKTEAWKNTGAPLHPGAVRFYKEFGGMK